MVSIVAYLHQHGVVFHNFGLCGLEKCSVCNSGRNFGSFASGKCVFVMVDAILAHLC